MDWNRLQTTLTRTALAQLGGNVDYTADSEDMAHDAIVKLLEKDVATEDDAFNLGTKIVIELCADLRRGEGRRREIEAEHGKTINRNLTGQSAESLAADPFEGLLKEAAFDRLCALSPLLYHTVRLHYIEGLRVWEIATQQKITEDVVYKRLQRARDIVTGDKTHET